MEEIFSTLALPCVTALVFAFFEAFKAATNGKVNKFIPLLSPIVGAVFAMALFAAAPQYVPADNLGMAALLGAISGLSATGAHQATKHMGGGKDE